MSKTTKKAKAASAVPAIDTDRIVRRINSLSKGKSVTIPDYGIVKCALAASETKDRKRRFTVSKSDRINSRKKFTFGELVSAFGLRH